MIDLDTLDKLKLKPLLSVRLLAFYKVSISAKVKHSIGFNFCRILSQMFPNLEEFICSFNSNLDLDTDSDSDCGCDCDSDCNSECDAEYDSESDYDCDYNINLHINQFGNLRKCYISGSSGDYRWDISKPIL